MPSTKPRANRTRFLALFTLFLIVASFSVSCNKNENRRNNVGQQTTASPSPSPVPSLSPQEGETIIVVKGGGSIDLNFDENIYKPQTTPSPHYVCDSCNFKTLNVTGIVGPCPIVNQNSTIQIDGGGGVKDVRIQRIPQHGIEIVFDKGEYGTPGGPHHGAHGHLKKVNANPPLNCQCPPSVNCEVKIATSYVK